MCNHKKTAYNKGFGASLARAGLATIKLYLSIARPEGRLNYTGQRQALPLCVIYFMTRCTSIYSRRIIPRILWYSFSLFWSSLVFGQSTVLWKVTNPKSVHVSYLFGTAHAFGESFIDSFPIIKEKLQASRLLISEVKIDRVRTTNYYNSRPSSDTIFSIMKEKDVRLISDIFKKAKSDVDISKLTPGELILKLVGYYPRIKCWAINKKDNWLMDEYLQHLAGLQQKSLYYLETDSFQLERITRVGQIYNWSFFKKNIPSLLKEYRSKMEDYTLCKIINQYASLNIDYKFEEPCSLLQNGDINELVFKSRNQNWIKILPSLLDDNDCFVAVGLGHFFNKCGLIKLLTDLGYVIEAIPMK